MSEPQYLFVKRSFYNWVVNLAAKLPQLLKFFSKDSKPPAFFTNKFLLGIVAQSLIYWLLSGFFILQAPMEGVITRLGNYQRTVGQGMHWHLRFFEKVFKIKVNQPKHQVYMLSSFTADANLITIHLDIEYSIINSRLFLLDTVDSEQYFSKTIASNLQKTVSQYTLTELLNSKTSFLIQKELREILKNEVARYPIGISLLGVALPALKLPIELKKDFESLQKTINQSKEMESKAQWQSKQLKHETDLKIQSLYEKANIQKHESINKAKSETNRFLALLPYYEKNPELILQRLQFEKTEKILKNPKKIVLIQPKGKFKDITPIHLSLGTALIEHKKDSQLKKESHHAE